MSQNKIIQELKIYSEGFLNSYAQIFFSQNKVFALVLLFVSFFDFGAGLSGVIALIFAQLASTIFNFNKFLIRDGKYTYNSLLVGLVIGIFYDFNLSLLILILISSLLTLFISVVVNKKLYDKGLPIMSIPFLLVIWIIILGANNFSVLDLKINDNFTLLTYFPETFEFADNIVATLPFADIFHVYFRSMGAIMFQYSDLAGIVLTLGLILYSRIAFVASFFGFMVGYLFYKLLHGDFSQLVYSYIGFNFILTSIGLGGFYIIANKRAFLLILFTIPMIAFLISALNSLFNIFNLPIYSLPFNLVIILVMLAMFQRTNLKGINIVYFQEYSPEKNHYKFLNANQRFKNNTYIDIFLPFIGERHISQGHNGEITHKKEWAHAFDFDIVDENNKTFNGLGTEVKNFYCYELPVIAPAAGWVEKIVDGIEDNKIGEIDIENNWGNTIIIKHSEYLYSKLSHLKKSSFKVKEGEWVEKGKHIANAGSSGRSPEPHLHFQIQATPYIGSKTLYYPLSHYLTKKDDKYEINFYKIPKENEKILNVISTKILKTAFTFIPGKIIEWQVVNKNKTVNQKWEIFTDIYNKTYIYCHNSKSFAYFYNNGTVFYFTDFSGNKNSLLFHFYSGSYKVLLGYYKGIKIEEPLISYNHVNPLLHFIHDFTAPFFHYFKATYNFEFTNADYEQSPENIEFTGNCEVKFFRKTIKNKKYTFIINNKGFQEFSFITNNKTITAKCLN